MEIENTTCKQQNRGMLGGKGEDIGVRTFAASVRTPNEHLENLYSGACLIFVCLFVFVECMCIC